MACDGEIGEVELTTSRRCEMIDITAGVEAVVRRLELTSGAVMIASPHTTAAVTINEGFDPAVCEDLLSHLEDLVPKSRRFTHGEGNSDAHIKVSLVGSSQLVMVSGGSLTLGRWQRIFFCELDGPRRRRYLVGGLSCPRGGTDPSRTGTFGESGSL